LTRVHRATSGLGMAARSGVTIRLTDLSRFAYHVFMTGGQTQGFDEAGAARRSGSLMRLAIMLGFIAVVVLLYRFSGVDRSVLAGESAFALAALIPLATIYRPGLLALRPAPAQEPHATVMATQRSAS
jgi:hypothetical protein